MPNLDLWPLLETLPIKTKQAKVRNLNRTDAFSWAQRELVYEVERQYNAGLPVRIIVLKGRQVGISTLSEALLFLWCFLHPGTNSLVLSKERPDSEYLFSMAKRYWERGPFHSLFTTKYNREGYIEWNGLGSTFLTETANKADVGRGHTFHAVHGSELAFWDRADDIVASLSESVAYEHGTIVIYESTAQGVGGYFHDEWMKAIDPSGDKSTFTPMFFPWWEHDEYSIPGAHLRYQDLDEEERELAAAYPKITLAKLAWRRRKLTTYTNPETFHEEYPVDWAEAFLATGTNVFPLQKLQLCYEPMRGRQGFLYNDNGRLSFMETDSGHMWLYRDPDPYQRRRYAVAVDPSQTVDGDPCCIQVLDRASMEQVAVWHGAADPETIGHIALAIAMYYGPDTILNTEVQGGGRRTLQIWRAASWPHIWYDERPDSPRGKKQSLCWNATYETKRWMIGTMQGVVARAQVKIHHAATYYEMSRYVNHDDEFGPSRRSGHDDTVTSLGIAIMTVITERPNMDWAAMAAPAPAYIPGITPPRLANVGHRVDPDPQARFGAQGPDTDLMIGVEELY